jgi:hypothetical protein
LVDENKDVNTQPAASAEAPVAEAPMTTIQPVDPAIAAASTEAAEPHELPIPPVEPPVVEEPVKAIDPANTDNFDSLGTAQYAEINGANLGPRGEGVPADALVPDTRSPVEKAKDSTSTVTDNIDSRGEDQGDVPAFGPRGTGVKSSPETFRH